MHRVFCLVFLACLSCTAKQVHTRDLSFQSPQTFSEKFVYHVAKPLALTHVSFAPITREMPITGYERFVLQGRSFLMDIGGSEVEIPLKEGRAISAMYFNPKLYFEKQFTAYAKWKMLFKEPRNTKLVEMFEIDFGGRNLPSLFSLPSLTFLSKPKKTKHGILILPAHDVPFELDPKAILSFLARGYHVLVINYQKTDLLPPWESTCRDSEEALAWLKHTLGCQNNELLIYGKAFGSAPAIYAASTWKNAHLILDRPFARMSDACLYHTGSFGSRLLKPFSQNFIETFYRYPNEDWLRYISGDLLILEGRENSCFKGHAERLIESFNRGKPKEVCEQFKNTRWLLVPGSLHESYWENGPKSWYSDEKSQEKITHFLNEL